MNEWDMDIPPDNRFNDPFKAEAHPPATQPTDTLYKQKCPRCTFEFISQGECTCVCHSFPEHMQLQDALDALKFYQAKSVGGATESAGTQPYPDEERWLDQQDIEAGSYIMADGWAYYRSDFVQRLLKSYAAQLSGDLRAAQQERDGWIEIADRRARMVQKAEQDYAREHREVERLKAERYGFKWENEGLRQYNEHLFEQKTKLESTVSELRAREGKQ